MDEAKAIVALDPLVQNGCVDYQINEWCVVWNNIRLARTSHTRYLGML